MHDTVSLVFVYANEDRRLRADCSPGTMVNEIVDRLVEHWRLPTEGLNIGYRLDLPRKSLSLERNCTLAQVGVQDGDLLRLSQVFSVCRRHPAPWLDELQPQATGSQPQKSPKDIGEVGQRVLVAILDEGFLVSDAIAKFGVPEKVVMRWLRGVVVAARSSEAEVRRLQQGNQALKAQLDVLAHENVMLASAIAVGTTAKGTWN